MKILLFFILLYTQQAMAYFAVEPTYPGNLFTFSNALPVTISIANKSSSPATPNISLTNNFFSIKINRCVVTIASNRICYIMISPNLTNMDFGDNFAQIQDNSSTLLTLKYYKPIVTPPPVLEISPTAIDFGTVTTYGETEMKVLTLENTGTEAFSPVLYKSSRIQVVVNRCLGVNLYPHKTCSVYFKMLISGADANQTISTEYIKFKPTSSSTTEVILSTLITTNMPVVPETSYAEAGTASDRTVDNDFIVHSVIGNEIMTPRSNNGYIIWSGEMK